VELDVQTIPALLAKRCRDDGDREAIVTNDRTITYGELDEASASIAAYLVANGVVKGDRLGLLAPNGIEWAVVAFAVTRIGAVLVPLSTLLRPPELIAQVRTASVTHLVVASEFRGRRYLDELELAHPSLVDLANGGRRGAVAPSLRRVWPLEHLRADPYEPAVSGALVRAMESRVRPADDFVVLFTSGSAGPPKGVIHTHGSALRATAAGLDPRRVLPGERLYIPMPFFWTGGLGTGLLSTLIAGATLLTEAEPEPASTLAFLERERVTLFRGWPDQAAKLAAHPAFPRAVLSSLGDGSLPAVLSSDRRPAPGARPNVFGMTESFGPYCGDRLDVDMPREKFGSCGRPFADVEVRIADQETGEEMAEDEPGEIWIRGRNILRGICGRIRSSVFTADGWYRTGDLGRLDADGYLWYHGRLDDMFKVKGATVYPSEVESALRSVDAIRRAHVTDVVGDDGRSEVGALVVTEAPVEDVITAAKERLSAFKVPSRWYITADADEVPILATGKVDKGALRALLRSKEDA
jgi:acyl-CoA synthetase (AMP-forming)/AMP-acid ligase II